MSVNLQIADRNPIASSIFISLLVHLLLLFLLPVILLLNKSMHKSEAETQSVNEVTVFLPDFIKVAEEKKKEIAKPKKKTMQIVDVDEQAKSEKPLAEAKFKSHKDSRAQSVQANKNLDLSKTMPAQDGIELKNISLYESDYNKEKLAKLNQQTPPQKKNEIKRAEKKQTQEKLPKTSEVEKKLTKKIAKEINKDLLEKGEEIPLLLPPIAVEEAEKEKSGLAARKELVERLNRQESKQSIAQTPEEFSPTSRKNKTAGNIFRMSSHSSVDAVKTAAGEYSKIIKRHISKLWNLKHEEYADLTKWGSLTIRFTVRSDGKVEDIKIVLDDAGAIMKSYTLEAIHEAQLPPLPLEVQKELGSKDFIVYFDFMVL